MKRIEPEYPTDILQIVPAEPGWRLLRVNEEAASLRDVREERIIAWATTRQAPGTLLPVVRGDGCYTDQRATSAQPEDSERYTLGILDPTESIAQMPEFWERALAENIAERKKAAEAEARAFAERKARGVSGPPARGA